MVGFLFLLELERKISNNSRRSVRNKERNELRGLKFSF